MVAKRFSIMVAFLTVMFPLSILRNALDLSAHYTWYLIYIVVAFVVLICLLNLGKSIRFIAKASSHLRFLFWTTSLATVGSCVHFLDLVNAYDDAFLASLGQTISVAVIPLAFGWVLASQPVREQTSRRFVSWIGLLSMLTSICMTCHFLIRYDPAIPALAFEGAPRDWHLDGWKDRAEQSRVVRQATNHAARMWGRAGSQLMIDLPENNGQEIINQLGHLQIIPPPWSVCLLNVKRDHDLSPLRGTNSTYIEFVVSNSEWTAKHMWQLGGGLKSLWLNDSRILSIGARTSSPVILKFNSIESIKNLSALINGSAEVSSSTSRSISAPFTLQDWFAIAELSQETRVSVSADDLSGVVDRMLEIPKSWKMNGLQLDVFGDVGDPIVFLKLAIDHAAAIKHNYAIEKGSQLEGKLSLAAPNFNVFVTSTDNPAVELIDQVRSYGWSYRENDEGKITHLWWPTWIQLNNDLSKINELRELRIDSRGFLPDSLPTKVVDPSIIRQLVKLESLYLSDALVDDYDAILQLPALKRLQIRSPELGRRMIGDFSKAKQLESLRLFYDPPLKTLKQLAAAPALKQIEIIDDGYSLRVPQAIADLKAQLPNVAVTVINPRNYKPDLSERFINHREKLKEEVLRDFEAHIASLKDEK